MNGKQGITPVITIKMATAFANTSPEFWLKVQSNYDLAQPKKLVKTDGIRFFLGLAA